MATDDAARDAPPPRALWYAGPRIARIAPAARHLPPARAEDPLAEAPGAPWVSVRTLFSALSRGTERLVFNDRVPASERDRMRAPFQEGAFPYPVKYGYANVGEVVAASADAAAQALIGRRVFSLFPHQDRFAAPLDAVTPLPERGGPPPDRATLAANMETALTALWDGAAAPGDRIAVVGAGVLGGLIAGLAGRLPGAEVVLVDVQPERAGLAEALGVRFAEPGAPAIAGAAGADLVLHTSATAAGLAQSLELAGPEATVIEASWHGDRAPSAPLGGAFHSQRLRLISSQVGRVPPARAPRWSLRRRLAKAIELLADPRYEALVTERLAFEDLPGAAPRLLSEDGPAPGLATVARYRPAEPAG